jgi:hypothetical protein
MGSAGNDAEGLIRVSCIAIAPRIGLSPISGIGSVMAIQRSDEAVETLIYDLDDKGTARVRMVNGKVVSVQVLD